VRWRKKNVKLATVKLPRKKPKRQKFVRYWQSRAPIK
jgi:hypothetical protein